MGCLGDEAVGIYPQTFFLNTFQKAVPVTGGKLSKQGMAGICHDRLLLKRPPFDRVAAIDSRTWFNGRLCGQRPEPGPAHRPWHPAPAANSGRSEEHTSELQSRPQLVCRLLLEKK